jgi:hypothetical protein
MASYSSTFIGTENPLSESSNWINGAAVGVDWHDCQKTPGLVFGTDPGTVNFTDSNACLTGSWGVNQRARGTAFVQNPIGGAATEEIELLLHWSIAPSVTTGYECTIGNHPAGSADRYVQFNRWNGGLGSFTLLAAILGPGIATGDIVYFTAIGSPNPVLSVQINGVTILSYDTATGNDGGTPGTPDSVVFTGGSPGVGFYNFTGGSGVNSDYGWSRFDATDGYFFGDFVQGAAQEIGSSGHAVAKAYASDVAFGDLLVVGTYMAGTAGTCTVTDTRSNSWTTVETSTNATDGHQIFLSWARSKDAGACTITSSVSGNSDTTFMGVVIGEYAGTYLNLCDKHTHNTGNSAAASSSATTTTAYPSEVCIGVIGGDNSSSSIAPSGTNGYVVEETVMTGGHFQMSLLDNTVTQLGTQTATATLADSQQWSAIVATFPESQAPPPSAPTTAPNLNWPVFRQRVWEDK